MTPLDPARLNGIMQAPTQNERDLVHEVERLRNALHDIAGGSLRVEPTMSETMAGALIRRAREALDGR